MPQQNPQSNIPPEELYRQPGAMPAKKNWFALHHLLAYVLFGLLAVLALIGTYYYQVVQFNSSDYQAPFHHPKTNTTSDWKTYTNSEYGFELKFPNNDYELIEKKDGVNLNAKVYNESPGINIIVSTDSMNSITTKIVSQVDDFLKNSVDIKDIQFAGVQAKEISYGIAIGGTLKDILIQKDDKVFDIRAIDDSSPNNIENRIMASFKFIDKDQVSCTQVITRAKNIKTGEVKDFPTPCDVPTGWQIMGPASALK
jgi:hypothetical protein